LDRALGVKLWATSVLDTVGEDAPPEWMTGEFEISLWHQSKAIEQQLQQALAARREARRRAKVAETTPPPAS
jgi:hypothetical protein